jgi:uncharacterized protein YbjT (DUF2867 family)
MSRIVAVVGATGTQGKSVVDALLADGTFVPRALTRNDTSEAAQALKAKGSPVVKVDPTSTESLTEALRGSEAVFLITAVLAPQSELDQAQRVIEASKNVGVNFVVFTSLPRMVRVTEGQLDEVIYDQKTQIEDYIRSSGLPHSILYLGNFLENAWKQGFLRTSASDPTQADYLVPRSSPDHVETFTWAERDVGKAVLALVKHYRTRPEVISGSKFYVLNERLQLAQHIEILGKVIGKKVNYVHLESTGHTLRDAVLDIHRDNGSYVGIAVPDPRLVELGVQFGTVEEWANANKGKLLATMHGTPASH